MPPICPTSPEVRGDLASTTTRSAGSTGSPARCSPSSIARPWPARLLILFLSDNGRPFPHCKTTVYDSGIGTPSIDPRWPDHINPGSHCDRLVSSIDIAPTFLYLSPASHRSEHPGQEHRAALFRPAPQGPRPDLRRANWHDFAACAARSARSDSSTSVTSTRTSP